MEEHPSRVTQSVTSLTANPGDTRSIPTRSHTFVEIDQVFLQDWNFWASSMKTLKPCKTFSQQNTKRIDISISDNMDWGHTKAIKTLSLLSRNLAFAHKSTKEVAYKTLVLPKLEYAAPIWSPYSNLRINQVEKVQRTAARWNCRKCQKHT